jgi:hypothetical protein
MLPGCYDFLYGIKHCLLLGDRPQAFLESELIAGMLRLLPRLRGWLNHGHERLLLANGA